MQFLEHKSEKYARKFIIFCFYASSRFMFDIDFLCVINACFFRYINATSALSMIDECTVAHLDYLAFQEKQNEKTLLSIADTVDQVVY